GDAYRLRLHDSGTSEGPWCSKKHGMTIVKASTSSADYRGTHACEYRPIRSCQSQSAPFLKSTWRELPLPLDVRRPVSIVGGWGFYDDPLYYAAPDYFSQCYRRTRIETLYGIVWRPVRVCN